MKVQTIIVDANDDINHSKVLEPRFRGKVAKKITEGEKELLLPVPFTSHWFYVADKKYLWN